MGTLDTDNVLSAFQEMSARLAAAEDELKIYRQNEASPDVEESRRESWNKQHRDWCEAMACDPEVGAGARWLCLGFLCWANIDHAGHAPLGRAEIMRSLGVGNVKNLYRDVTKAKAHKLIGEASTIDCLVAPPGVETSDPKVRRHSCRFDH